MKKATTTLSLVSAACLAGGAVLATAQEARAQALPPPASLMKSLDLACHKVSGETNPPVQSLVVKHLNPVLQQKGFGTEQTSLGQLEQLCVPVAKNNAMPGPDTYPFIQYIDLACYAAKSTVAHETQISLTQLNPVVRSLGLPDHQVIIRDLQQICVPVIKEGAVPPASVLPLIRHVDVACYKVDVAQNLPQLPLKLKDLNPLFSGVAPQDVRTMKPEQLCVPVAKSISIPVEVQKIVKWIDFEKFGVYTNIVSLPRTVNLRHANPQFTAARPFKIEMYGVTHLDLPVAKNQMMPPSALTAD